MSDTTDGCFGKYETANPFLPGFSMISVEKFVEEVKDEIFKNEKTSPNRRDYKKTLLENKEYIKKEFDYIKNSISKKDISSFKKEIKNKDKTLYRIINE